MPRRKSLKRGTPVTSNGVIRYEVLSGDSANNKWYNTAPKAAYDATLVMTAGDWPNFDGVGDYAHTGTLNSQPITETFADYTFESWIKADAIGAGDRIVFMTAVGNQDALSLLMNPGSSQAWSRVFSPSSGSHVNIYGATSISTGAWHHLVMVADSTANTCKLYLDNDLDGSGAYTAPLTTDKGCFIGVAYYHAGFVTQYFDGLCDNVRIYNKALSADEVARNYYAGKAVHT
jgi:hypothetical protein